MRVEVFRMTVAENGTLRLRSSTVSSCARTRLENQAKPQLEEADAPSHWKRAKEVLSDAAFPKIPGEI
jgi:hypothetical protein